MEKPEVLVEHAPHFRYLDEFVGNLQLLFKLLELANLICIAGELKCAPELLHHKLLPNSKEVRYILKFSIA